MLVDAFSAGPMQPVLVDVGDHLVDGRVVRLDVQDRFTVPRTGK